MQSLAVLALMAVQAGMVCIAPFHAPTQLGEPNMSATTWAPSAQSTFVFRMGKRVKASVRSGEIVAIKDVPTDRKVLVAVTLDGKPFESFRIDLRKEPDHRVCLWLREGYWHWIDTGWDAQHGCRCK